MPKSTTSASSDLTPEQRRQQLAAILARGVLRVLRQAGCRPDRNLRNPPPRALSFRAKRGSVWLVVWVVNATPNQRGNHATRHSDAEVANLQAMSTGELARRYAEVFGEQARTRHKAYLIRRIAWRIQALAEGDLSERARDGPRNWPTTPTFASRRRSPTCGQGQPE